MKKKWNKWLFIALLFIAPGCNQVKKIIDKSSPREKFTEDLENSPINEKAFVRDWKDAWQKALAQPVDITLPYQEKGLIFPDDPQASAFRFVALRGENLIIQITSTTNIFAEVFTGNELGQALETPSKSPSSKVEPLAFLKPEEDYFKVEVNSPGSYILAIQPELLANGSYTLTIKNEASVAFPVSGLNSYNIQSFWGASRDGGKRRHEGVDIFAPKGTPVLAVASGVARATTNRLGGKVIWHRTDKGQNFYYAHLDSQAISRKQVKTGDTLGFVGNTGNAKHTPPHLHFGIYLRGRGAVDPFPYINNMRPDVPEIIADSNWKEHFARISGKAANFRITPSIKSDPDTVLQKNTIVIIKSATLDWYRIALPDGKNGFVHSSLVEKLQLLPDSLTGLSYMAFINPWTNVPAADSLQLGDQPQVYGNYGGHYLAKHPTGNFLWLKPRKFLTL